ncbi:TPA: 3-(3-hydroxy-phenyl)propionate transporter MhpT, partial [Burkholderia aenigmatica]|nr:3-(3-hydroxy-phenyl)propionate transporter MhpT [Burkholderia aenigmatica]
MNTYVAERPAVATTLALCFAIALLEGLDLQSVGVAAPRMAREFGLTVSQMGIAFSAGTFGLLPGAMLGGRLADRIGRKRVLIASVALFGLLSIATAQASSFAMLVVVRVLTGLGLGGAMPNLIALSSEAVEPRSRSSAVATMYCGIPFGGVIASLIGVLLAGDTEWRHIFYVGGAGPLLLVPLLAMLLPESRAYLDIAGTSAARTSVARTLFGDGRTISTLALWISYFCTLIVLYFLLNWLPSLMAARGLDREHVGLVQIAFNVGGGLGALGIGAALDRMRASRVVGGMYVGIVLSLAALAAAPGFASLAAAAFAAGMFVVGGQSVLYALAAIYYPTAMRG